MQAWNHHQLCSLGISCVDFTDTYEVSVHVYNQFRVLVYDQITHISSIPKHSYCKPSSFFFFRWCIPGYAIITKYLATEFKKSTKRDKTHNKVCKDDKQWDNWRQKTIAKVNVHGCENILSASFLPSIPDDVLLFQEQNKFMYDIFMTILQTPMGIHFVHAHYVTRDA